ncbi:hypothetical protein AGMMS49921_02400 [Endomicrobiia bacterium]|nr:hypothetical protein AGMMS49921_02400 [Endomicrobiia bacterium]
MERRYQVVIIGAGHAGCEASLVCARMGLKTLVLTLNVDSIARMSCNPAIGGIAKGQMVREIDAMGGEMGQITDHAGLQFKMLNSSRGPAVWSPRAQCDKELYSVLMSKSLQNQSKLEILQSEATSLIVKNGKVCGVKILTGETINADAVVVTTGTFLKGAIHLGKMRFDGGRFNERSASYLSISLAKDCGLTLGRFKTTTTPRINTLSIDYSKMTEQLGDEGEVILSQTSFYAQSGGQSSDKGKIENNNFEADVEGVFKPIGNLFAHKVKVIKGLLKAGENISTIIDTKHRKQIAIHHTATHILHKALREVFGDHMAQAGSLVTSDYLRFDFTHFSAIKKEELIKIEKRVNSVVRVNSEVCIETMDMARARNLGAMALFGEKYGDVVRTVSIKSEDNNATYSMELCGGTHVSRTGDIGMFKIISESSIAAGIRRIKAVVGAVAENYILDEEDENRKLKLELDKKDASIRKVEELIDEINGSLSVQKHIPKVKLELDKKDASIIKASERIDEIIKKCNALKNSFISKKIDFYIKQMKEVNGINFLPILVDNVDVKMLRDMSDRLKEKLKSVVLVIASKNEDKAFFVVSATEDYVQKGFNSSKIAKAFAVAINGCGGGKPDFAQGGSKDLSRLSDVIKNAEQYI